MRIQRLVNVTTSPQNYESSASFSADEKENQRPSHNRVRNFVTGAMYGKYEKWFLQRDKLG